MQYAPDHQVPFEESVGALAELQREGKIRWIGLSNVSVAEIKAAEAIAEVATVQNRLNPFFREAIETGVVRYCGERGIGFLAYSPTGGGRLTKKLPGHAVLQRISAELGFSPHALVIAWGLAQGPSVLSIPSARTEAHVRDSALAGNLVLSDADPLGHLRSPLRPVIAHVIRCSPHYFHRPCRQRGRRIVPSHRRAVDDHTDTADVTGTVRQVAELARAGSELVRATVNNEEAARAVPQIVEGLDRIGVHVPSSATFTTMATAAHAPSDCAAALAKFRINPGNVGGKHADTNFRAIIEVALAHGKPVRIGVNWGSLDQQLLTELMDANALLDEPHDARDVMMEAMVQSAVRSAAFAETVGMASDRIILSAKVSGVQDLIDVYRMLARRSDYPLHLGLTEAGMGRGGVGRKAGLGPATGGSATRFRVSLTPAPGDRAEEVRGTADPQDGTALHAGVTSAGCGGRTASTFFQHMAQDIEAYLRQKMPVWGADRPGVRK
jgi:(E)-4-hydroxy-3-methylbut-2-enyl-diphosphate synthase